MKNLFEKSFVWLFFLLLVSGPIDGQITFEKTYGEEGWNYGGTSVQQTKDGGYILFGIARNRSDDKYSWSLIKTDSLGEVQWQKKFGDEYLIDSGNSVQQTSDGGYILCGSFGAPIRDSVMLVKTDDQGNIIWTNSYSMSKGDSAGNFVQQTTDGGFILAGYTGENVNGGFDYNVLVIKTDDYGIVEWKRTYGGTFFDKGYCIKQTQSGDYIVLGETLRSELKYEMYVLKLNNIGDTIWTRTYGTAMNDGGFSLDLTSDGGFICLGIGGIKGTDFLAIKVDSEGNEMWSKSYGGYGWDIGYCVQQASDGGYFMTGRFSLGGFKPAEMHCIKTNALGDVLWERGYRKGLISECHSAQQTRDGGYVMLGGAIYENEPNIPEYMYLVKVDSNGKVITSENPEREYTFLVCPNPFVEYTFFKLDFPIDSDYTLQIFASDGKEVYVQSGWMHDDIYLNRQDLPGGVYFFKIISGDKVIGKGKFIAQ